jgi:hypothetical protein
VPPPDPRILRPAVRVFAPLLLTLLFSCGAPETDTRPATHADFREVQIAEAGAAEALPVARSVEAPCERRCRSASDVCAAERAICGLARETEDLDLRARCRTAADGCAEAGALTARDCSCEEAGAP